MKNVELEYKYQIDDLVPHIEQLKKLGGRFQKEFQGIDIYFVVPNNQDGKKYLRVREKAGKAEINYHFVHSDLKTDEWEVEIESADAMIELLKQLSFKVDVVVEKKRQIYKYQNSKIAFDVVKDLGFFVEIESQSEKELLVVAKELGVTDQQRISGQGYPDLIRKKNK